MSCWRAGTPCWNAASTVEEGVDAAQQLWGRLVGEGIDLQDIVERRLIEEGAGLCVDSFDRLLAGLQKKYGAVSVL